MQTFWATCIQFSSSNLQCVSSSTKNLAFDVVLYLVGNTSILGAGVWYDLPCLSCRSPSHCLILLAFTTVYVIPHCLWSVWCWLDGNGCQIMTMVSFPITWVHCHIFIQRSMHILVQHFVTSGLVVCHLFRVPWLPQICCILDFSQW